MRSLVTGGAGFLGSHVVDSLIDFGHEVFVLDDLSGGFLDNVNKKAEMIVGSVVKESTVDSLFEKLKFDYVFHLAAYAAEGLSHFIRRYNYANNVIGSVNLINASVRTRVKCFVFTSSIAVYGSGQVPMVEGMIPSPEDPYGIAKYAVEMDLKAAHEMFGLNYIIFRPHNVYGKRQNLGDPYRNVIGIFMNQIMQGKPLTIFGDGTQTRAFSHVQDVAPIIAESVFQSDCFNDVYNIGSDTPYSVNELAEKVQQTMMREAEIIHLPARKEVLHAFSNHDKLRLRFGRHMNTPLDMGLMSMAAWAEKAGIRKTKFFPKIEVEQELPESWKNLTKS